MIIVCGILLVLYFLSHAEWFNIFSILTSGDWFYQGPNLLSTTALQSFHMWSQNVGYGGASLDIGMRLPLIFIAWLTAYFDIPYALGQRIVWFFPMILFSIGGSYLLFRHIFKSNLSILAASLIYNFNVYFSILQISGHMGIALGYAIMPICIYFIIRLCEKESLRNLILASLSLFFLSLYEPRIAYIGLGLFILIGLYYRIRIRSVFGVITLFTLLSSFSLFPVLFGGIYGNNELTTQSVFGNQFMSLSNSIALFHTFWSGAKLEIFSMNPIPFYFWIVPIMAVLGYMIHKRTVYIGLFGIITLLGIFLTKQGDAPFPGFYQWAYDTIPLFNLFRESSKFYIILILGYAGMVGFFIDGLISLKKHTSAYVALGGVLMYTLTNLYPLITKDVGTMFVPRYIPQDYQIFSRYLQSDPLFSRVAMVPFYSRWLDYSITHPAISTIPAQKTSKNHLFTIVPDPYFPDTNQIIHSDALKETIKFGNIGYIVIAMEDKGNDDFYTYNNLNRIDFLDTFEGIKYLKKLDLGMKELIVYQVDKSFIGTRIGGDGMSSLKFQRQNASEYSIHISLTGSSNLSFLESFHPGWRIYLEPYSDLECGVAKYQKIQECPANSTFLTPGALEKLSKAPLGQATHKKIYNFANSWNIDPETIKNQYSKEYYKENPDGTIDVRLSLYFFPESYFYLGILISGSTLLACFTYLLYASRKRKISKKEHTSL